MNPIEMLESALKLALWIKSDLIDNNPAVDGKIRKRAEEAVTDALGRLRATEASEQARLDAIQDMTQG